MLLWLCYCKWQTIPLQWVKMDYKQFFPLPSRRCYEIVTVSIGVTSLLGYVVVKQYSLHVSYLIKYH